MNKALLLLFASLFIKIDQLNFSQRMRYKLQVPPKEQSRQAIMPNSTCPNHRPSSIGSTKATYRQTHLCKHDRFDAQATGPPSSKKGRFLTDTHLVATVSESAAAGAAKPVTSNEQAAHPRSILQAAIIPLSVVNSSTPHTFPIFPRNSTPARVTSRKEKTGHPGFKSVLSHFVNDHIAESDSDIGYPYDASDEDSWNDHASEDDDDLLSLPDDNELEDLAGLVDMAKNLLRDTRAIRDHYYRHGKDDQDPLKSLK